MIDRQELILKIQKIVIGFPHSFWYQLRKENLDKFIMDETSFLPSEYKFSYRVFCVLNNIKEMPICANISNNIHYIPSNKCDITGHPKYCSCKCSNSDKNKIQKTKQIFLKKYNSTSPLGNKEIRHKGNETKIAKYGDKNYNNRKKAAITKFINHGDEKYNNSEKRKITNLEKYGHENAYAFGTEKFETNLVNKYGCHYTNRDQYKKTVANFSTKKKQDIKNRTTNTCKKKYNVACVFSSKEIRCKAKNTSKNNYGDENYNNRQQAQKTCLTRYGVTSFSQTEEFKSIWKNEERKSEIITKQYNSKKERNTFKYSSFENKGYGLLQKIFPDVIRQYKSIKYPFNCDFYIPSKDIYIEFQGSWTHGKHPFNENNAEDILTLKKWKDNANKSKYYKIAIEVWTKRDPLKKKYSKTK